MYTGRCCSSFAQAHEVVASVLGPRAELLGALALVLADPAAG
jgi:hypothetical protein